jgi:glutathione synthase/RimK-type ligase-like ATP-grasp enzyme
MLPETYLYSPTKIRYLLSKYPVVYAKPVHGTGGRGVIQIVRSGKNDYLLYGRDLNRVQKKERVTGERAVQLRIQRWINDQPYLVQQGLDLSLIRDRVVDMRLLIQKVNNSDWKVTGYGMRVGGKQSATSNLHGGGKGVEAKRMLTHVFGRKKYVLIRRQFLSLSHKVSLAIEKMCGPMIELGLDIGIDTKGKVWLIEANSMPGRELFKKIRNAKMYDKAVQRPLSYIFAQYSERGNETRNGN